MKATVMHNAYSPFPRIDISAFWYRLKFQRRYDTYNKIKIIKKTKNSSEKT